MYLNLIAASEKQVVIELVIIPPPQNEPDVSFKL